MENPDISTRQICERFEISRATLYRYVGPNGERHRQGYRHGRHAGQFSSLAITIDFITCEAIDFSAQ